MSCRKELLVFLVCTDACDVDIMQRHALTCQLFLVACPEVDVPFVFANCNIVHVESCVVECIIHFVANLKTVAADAGGDDGHALCGICGKCVMHGLQCLACDACHCTTPSCMDYCCCTVPWVVNDDGNAVGCGDANGYLRHLCYERVDALKLRSLCFGSKFQKFPVNQSVGCTMCLVW